MMSEVRRARKWRKWLGMLESGVGSRESGVGREGSCSKTIVATCDSEALARQALEACWQVKIVDDLTMAGNQHRRPIFCDPLEQPIPILLAILDHPSKCRADAQARTHPHELDEYPQRTSGRSG